MATSSLLSLRIHCQKARYDIAVDSQETVASLHQKISDLTGIAPDRQRLISAPRAAFNNPSATLQASEVRDSTKIFVYQRNHDADVSVSSINDEGDKTLGCQPSVANNGDVGKEEDRDETPELTLGLDDFIAQNSNRELVACSYTQGYIMQDVYVCKTCQKDEDHPVGICYGCMTMCHVGHDIFPLDRRRHFRCDCRTPRAVLAGGCRLVRAGKTHPLNVENAYNLMNFKGLYCYCGGPDDGEMMVQCSFCFDWFHRAHLAVPEALLDEKLDTDDEAALLLCRSCLKAFPYLIPTGLCSSSTSSSPTPAQTHPSLASVSTSSSSSSSSSASKDSTSFPRDRLVWWPQPRVLEAYADSEAPVVSIDSKQSPSLTSCGDDRHKANEDTEYLMSAEALKYLCRCDACRLLYERHGLDWILLPEPDQCGICVVDPASDDEDSENEQEDNHDENEGQSNPGPPVHPNPSQTNIAQRVYETSVSMLESRNSTTLSHNQKLIIANGVREYLNHFEEMLANCTDHTIDVADVNRMTEKMKESMKKRRREQEEDEGL